MGTSKEETVQRTKWQRVSVLSTGTGNGVTLRAVAVALAHQHPLGSGRVAGFPGEAGGMGTEACVLCGLRGRDFHRQRGAVGEWKERWGVACFLVVL